jgi:hypothetical protein
VLEAAFVLGMVTATDPQVSGACRATLGNHVTTAFIDPLCGVVGMGLHFPDDLRPDFLG